MAVTGTVYGKSLLSMASKLANLGSDALKVMLTTSAYTPNADTHQFQSDVTNEITGTGYTAGGAALAGVTLTYDGTNHWLILKASNTAWTGATFTARRAVVYDSTPGSAATNPLLGWVDFGADQSPAGVTFEIDWDATNGVFKWPQS